MVCSFGRGTTDGSLLFDHPAPEITHRGARAAIERQKVRRRRRPGRGFAARPLSLANAHDTHRASRSSQMDPADPHSAVGPRRNEPNWWRAATAGACAALPHARRHACRASSPNQAITRSRAGAPPHAPQNSRPRRRLRVGTLPGHADFRRQHWQLASDRQPAAGERRTAGRRCARCPRDLHRHRRGVRSGRVGADQGAAPLGRGGLQRGVADAESVQPPPSARYSATPFCACCVCTCTSACWDANSERCASSTSRKLLAPLR